MSSFITRASRTNRLRKRTLRFRSLFAPWWCILLDLTIYLASLYLTTYYFRSSWNPNILDGVVVIFLGWLGVLSYRLLRPR